LENSKNFEKLFKESFILHRQIHLDHFVCDLVLPPQVGDVSENSNKKKYSKAAGL